MSTNNWERGEIKLPSNQAVAFRHSMVNFYNAQQTRFFERAQSLYTQLKAASKGKRNFDFGQAFENLLTGNSMYRSGCDESGYYEIQDALFPTEQTEKGWQRSRKPKAPKKSQFKHAKLSTKGLAVGHEAGINFNGSTLVWVVSENNHAVERAHDHPVAKEFFRLLSQVQWSNRSGGEIVGNDEYNQDNTHSGGGANYVTHRFGSAEKSFKKSFGRRF